MIMIKNNLTRKIRPAIAMIELIFSIVIIGISMLTVPILVGQSTQSIYTSLQQESIAAAAVQISTIMSSHWDGNNTDLAITGTPVLQTTIVAGLPNCGTINPPGVTDTSGRGCRSAINPAATLNARSIGANSTEGTEGLFLDDVDDYNGQSYTISVYRLENTSTSLGDYIDKNITISSRVIYGDDVPRLVGNAASAGGYDTVIDFSNPFRNTIAAPNSSNIKLISVNLTSASQASVLNDKNITLSAFMCNIGAPRQIRTNK